MGNKIELFIRIQIANIINYTFGKRETLVHNTQNNSYLPVGDEPPLLVGPGVVFVHEEVTVAGPIKVSYRSSRQKIDSFIMQVKNMLTAS